MSETALDRERGREATETTFRDPNEVTFDFSRPAFGWSWIITTRRKLAPHLSDICSAAHERRTAGAVGAVWMPTISLAPFQTLFFILIF